MSGNRLASLPAMVPTLREVDLGGNPGLQLPADAAEVLAPLTNLTRLRLRKDDLGFDAAQWSDVSVRALMDISRRFPSLRVEL